MRDLVNRSASSATGSVLLALLLVIATAAASLGMDASSRSAQAPTPSTAPDSSAVPTPPEIDACALLTDDDLLRTTGALAVTLRVPEPPPGMPTGCRIDLEPVGETYGQPWTIHLGLRPTGGAAQFEQQAASFGGQAGAGLGSSAYLAPFGLGWSGVVGDALLSVIVTMFGGDASRPSADVSRLLLWRALTRIEATVPGIAAPTDLAGADGSEVRALLERVRATSFGPDVVDAVIEILARSGVATFESPSDVDPVMPVTEPASPLVLLRDQVRAMALEAWAGGGFSGADLDDLEPADSDLPGAADIVLGYVSGADTEGAQVARGLMGEWDGRPPQDLVFPQLALALMVTDVIRESQPSESSAETAVFEGSRMMFTRAVVGAKTRTAQARGACSLVTEFIDKTLSSVFDALRSAPSSGSSSGFFGAIWNAVVDAADVFARRIVKEVTRPVLDRIASVAAAVGLASVIISAIRPWALHVDAVPPMTVKGIAGGAGQPGQLVARVVLSGPDEWPTHVQDCARVAGQPLPNLKPEGAPVTWTAISQRPSGLVAEQRHSDKLDADATARLDFTTLVDDVRAPWEERPGAIGISVTVVRPQLRQLRQLAIDQILNQLPSLTRDLVAPLLRPRIEALTRKLDDLISSASSGYGTVYYHVPAPTPAPGITPAPTSPRAVVARLDRAAEPSLLAGRIVDLFSCDGPYGHWAGVLRVGGVSGAGLELPFVDVPLEFTFRGATGVQTAEATTSGRLQANLERLEVPFTYRLRIVVDGKTMTISGLADTTLPAAMDVTIAGSLTPELPIVTAPAGTCD